MSNKKFPKLAVLSLLGILALTGCSSSDDEIYAKPSTYDDSIITITKDGKEHGKDDIHNDVLNIIYDSMHDGSTPSKVLSKVLFKYAESVFGSYNRVTAKDDTVITIEDACNDDAKMVEFIKNHKVYWLYDEEGKHVKENGEEVDEANFVPCDTEKENVRSSLAEIELHIAESMYAKATGGSYTKKHFFSEFDFIEALYKEGKKVNYAAAKAANLKSVLIDYQFEKKDVFDATKGILHRAYYQDGANFTYIEDEVINDVYNDLLVEQYLLDEDIAAVRNSRARRINVIKIEKYSSFTNNADALIKDLVNTIYSYKPADNAHLNYRTSEIEAYYKDLFDTYAIVNKGLYNEISTNAVASAIVARLQAKASDIYEIKTYDRGTAATDDDIVYYNNTKYGDLIKDFEKFEKAATFEELDMSLYNKFTSSGTVTPEEGLDQATIDIDQTKTIYKDWYIQSSQPSLDSNGKINERLFTISVANSKIELPEDGEGDEEAKAANLKKLEENLDRFEKIPGNGNDWTWELRDAPSAEENKFLCSINGAYFLKFEGQYSQDNYLNDIVYDDGSAYYIVNVLEAVKDNKLKASGNNSYGKLRGVQFLNSVIDEISKKVAETGSYASLSKEYWLKKMDIKYHDQKVYDYFKDNYPDLFD